MSVVRYPDERARQERSVALSVRPHGTAASLRPSSADAADGDVTPNDGDRDRTHVYVRSSFRQCEVTRQGPGTRSIIVGSDAPTRLLSVAEVLAMAPPDGARGQVGTALSSRRRIGRRAVLLMALGAAFLFATGMRRVQHSAGFRRPAVAGGRPAQTADAAHRESFAATAASIDPPADTKPRATAPAPAKEPFLSPRAKRSRESVATSSGKTKDRLAADAFATGDYAQALAAYQELAAEQPDVKAYAQAVNVLRSWLSIAREPKQFGGARATGEAPE